MPAKYVCHVWSIWIRVETTIKYFNMVSWNHEECRIWVKMRVLQDKDGVYGLGNLVLNF